MNKLFKNIQNKIECQKNGICSKNPVLNSLEALIVNEVRQIAFYSVKLKEFNLINKEIMKAGVFALSVRISDMEFNRNSFFEFYNSVKNVKDEIKNFYNLKVKENNLPIEFVPPIFGEEGDENNISSLIQKGEKIIKQFYLSAKESKNRLINLIISISKSASKTLIELSKYKEADIEYYFEILRIFSLTNFLGTREEKLKRRILEFSKTAEKIYKDLNEEYVKKYGKIKPFAEIKTDIKTGSSILITGPDIDELYNLLIQTKDEELNVYISPNMIKALIYPEFDKFSNLIGVFGGEDIEYDFSKFKGGIYLTSNFSKNLDSSFRGSIFTTKIIFPTSSRKITKDDLSLLIDKSKILEGFDCEAAGEKIKIQTGFDKKALELNTKNLLVFGFLDNKIKEKFKEYKIFDFYIPNETTSFLEAVELSKKENTEIYFSNSSISSIGLLLSTLDKGFAKIYFEPVQNGEINPHAIDSLKLDFGVNII